MFLHALLVIMIVAGTLILWKQGMMLHSILSGNNRSASNTCIHFACIYGCINLCLSTIIAGTWNTFDAEIDAATKTGLFFVCIQFSCMYACIHCCFYIIIDWTENPLFTGNNAAFNACTFVRCIQHFCSVSNDFHQLGPTGPSWS